MELDEFEKKLETGEFVCFNDLRALKGVIQGEIISPTDDLDEFNQDEEVIIFNHDEFSKWYNTLLTAIEGELYDLKI